MAREVGLFWTIVERRLSQGHQPHFAIRPVSKVHWLSYRRLMYIILAVGIIYLVYQLRGVAELERFPMKKYRCKKNNSCAHADEKKSDFEYQSDDKKKHQAFFNQRFDSYLEYSAQNFTNNIPGVLPEHEKLYVPTVSETFRCILSGKEIPFAQMNDDFCDCDDFTDEPSTSACHDGKFFCRQKAENVKYPSVITSYMVNDGICDCCDGSDEWKYVSLPQHTMITENEQQWLGVYQVPCKSRCFS